ncbi:MAG TPA: amidohydrolase, partial [Eubacteriaceae bacterium]|nr:amidohydrolase [Eubacteriaceae bacterium]
MFIDVHMHAALDGIDSKAYRALLMQDEATARKMLKKTFQAYKSRGILAVRDGGDNLDLFRLARQVAEEENVLYRSPIFAIYK